MDLNEIKHNLRTFFRGEETREGRRLIDRWYRYFDKEPNDLVDYSGEEKEELRRELWEDITPSAGFSKKKLQLKFFNHSRSGNVWPARIAAGLIIVLLVSLPILYVQGLISPQHQSGNQIEHQTASNPAGQSSRIVLADGSTVWLSAASSLRYPKRFGDSLRSVRLTGEAFFEVAHNSDKPFIVHSGQLQTKVLGTSFNIRSFNSENDIQVTVATGRVSVGWNDDSTNDQTGFSDPITTLTPNQQLVFNTNTQAGTTKAVDSALYTSWKSGKLIFENHSFKEIAQRLERWYGVHIHFSDEALKQIRFKVTFENNSLQHALQMLQAMEDFEFEMKNNQVWIKSLS